MQKILLMINGTQRLNGYLCKAVEFVLYLLAIALACLIAAQGKISCCRSSLAILLPASLILFIPLKEELMVVIQKVVGIYLVCVLVERAATHHFVIDISRYHVNLSFSIVIVAFYLAGHLAGRFAGRREPVRIAENKYLRWAWRLTLGLIVLHMLFLGPMLRWFYGYGYERNTAVLGQIVLFYIVFMFLWRPLSYYILRGGAGVIFLIYCLLTYFKSL